MNPKFAQGLLGTLGKIPALVGGKHAAESARFQAHFEVAMLLSLFLII